jgi:hypothetical protein
MVHEMQEHNKALMNEKMKYQMGYKSSYPERAQENLTYTDRMKKQSDAEKDDRKAFQNYYKDFLDNQVFLFLSLMLSF